MLMNPVLTHLRCVDMLLSLSSPVVMGIINVTPDSFFKGSQTSKKRSEIEEKAVRMVEEGAKIIDLGGMSTRPGSVEISPQEEIDRVLPAIEIVSETIPGVIISVDTYRSSVAELALKAGARMVNDISGGALDEGMYEVVERYKAAYVLMHMRDMPLNMQNHTGYQDFTGDILKYFVDKLNKVHHVGIADIILDPGFGFSKTTEQNFQLVNQLSIFKMLGYPLMIGLSRKSSISKTINRKVEDTLAATTALHMAALANGASILRVHDVPQAVDTIAIYNKLRDVN